MSELYVPFDQLLIPKRPNILMIGDVFWSEDLPFLYYDFEHLISLRKNYPNVDPWMEIPHQLDILSQSQNFRIPNDTIVSRANKVKSIKTEDIVHHVTHRYNEIGKIPDPGGNKDLDKIIKFDLVIVHNIFSDSNEERMNYFFHGLKGISTDDAQWAFLFNSGEERKQFTEEEKEIIYNTRLEVPKSTSYDELTIDQICGQAKLDSH